MIWIRAVKELNSLKDSHRFNRSLLQLDVMLKRTRAGQADEPPSSLRRDPLIEDGIAQISASMPKARSLKSFAISWRKLITDLPHKLRERVSASPTINHTVRAIEGVVSSGAKGIAGTVRLIHEIQDEPPRLLNSNAQQLRSISIRIMHPQREGQADHAGGLA